MASSPDELLRPAQTNLQLYDALRRAGRPVADLIAVHRGYQLVIRLFAGQYRANGKPFAAHLVGTAGILTLLGERIEVVSAGLLHAAYTQGQFPGWRRRVTAAKRAEVRAAAGAAAEDLVARYAGFAWGPEQAARLLRERERLEPVERDLAILRLANELEDRLDRGLCYFASADRDRLDGVDAELADGLGHAELAAALRRARAETEAADVPSALRSARRSSFTVAPAPYRPRLELRLGRAAARLLGTLRPRT